MTKTVISKNKRDKIESILFALTWACFISAIMEWKVTDWMAKMRDEQIKEIMDLLDN